MTSVGGTEEKETQFNPPFLGLSHLHYTCKSLRPSDGNNPIEPSNEIYVQKTYTFDVTKCDEIYDLLVAKDQVVVPKDLKIPSLEQRQKRGFCKYHNILGHNTSCCSLFWDLVQKGLNDVAECQMVDIAKYPQSIKETATEPPFDEKIKAAYPTNEEELIDFLYRCKMKNSKVMLCPKCSVVFEKEATKSLKGVIPKPKKRRKWSGDHRPKFSFTKSYSPFINNSSTTDFVNKNGQGKVFSPHANALAQKWVRSTHKNVQHGKNNVVKGSTSIVFNKNCANSDSKGLRKYAYNNNYKGMNPMTGT